MAINDERWPVLEVEGSRKQALEEDLISLLVEETYEGLYRCELTFDNWSAGGYTHLDRSTLDFGKKITVKIADSEGSEEKIFVGKVTGIEANYPLGERPSVTVLVEDRLQDLRMTRRTRTFTEVSDSDVISQVISGHGLSASVSVTGVAQYPVLVQLNQSDLAFVRDRARAVDAEVWVDDTTVTVKPRKDRATGTTTLTYGQDLLEFSVLADLTSQRTKAVVGGWDVKTKEAIKAEAASSEISSEASGLTTGVSLLSSKFSDRVEQVVHTQPFVTQEAEYVAKAVLKRLARRFVSGVGLTAGNPAILVGTTVDLKALGEMFNGKYYVTEVRHMVDLTSGYRTQFRVERPGIGG